MKKQKNPKIIIMKPKFRQGAWLHGVDLDGWSAVVPVGCVGVLRENLPQGYREYHIGSMKI